MSALEPSDGQSAMSRTTSTGITLRTITTGGVTDPTVLSTVYPQPYCDNTLTCVCLACILEREELVARGPLIIRQPWDRKRAA